MKTNINQYDYIYLKENPDFDYDAAALPKVLPKHLTMAIEADGESKKLYIHSWLHSKRMVQVGQPYSLDWTDDDIIKDLSEEIEWLFMF